MMSSRKPFVFFLFALSLLGSSSRAAITLETVNDEIAAGVAQKTGLSRDRITIENGNVGFTVSGMRFDCVHYGIVDRYSAEASRYVPFCGMEFPRTDVAVRSDLTRRSKLSSAIDQRLRENNIRYTDIAYQESGDFRAESLENPIFKISLEDAELPEEIPVMCNNNTVSIGSEQVSLRLGCLVRMDFQVPE